MTFIRRFPARHLVNMRGDIERLYDEIFGSRIEDSESMGRVSPLVNIEETDQEFIVTVELPGMEKEDVKITFKDGSLSISGEKKAKKDEKDGNFHRYERQHGSFCRTFSVPNLVKADKIDASFKNGVLIITLPKAEEAKQKEIEINVK